MSPGDRVQAYARAFYEAALDRWIDALDAVAERLAEHPGMMKRVETSANDPAEQHRLLDSLMPEDVDPPVRNFLYTLLGHGDLGMLSEVSGALRRLMAQAVEGPVPVEVTTAVALTEDERQKLAARLAGQFGSQLDLRYHVDPAILGGVIIRAGDKLIDGSVATRLAEMKQALGVAARE